MITIEIQRLPHGEGLRYQRAPRSAAPASISRVPRTAPLVRESGGSCHRLRGGDSRGYERRRSAPDLAWPPKFGITLPNTPRRSTPDYRGELMVALVNLDRASP